jgi:hypothetical protein
MNNLLVCKNYNIASHRQWYNDRSHEENLEASYDKMQQLMIKSAQTNLIGLDDIQIHRGTALDIREVFKAHYFEIKALWEQGHNILYCDLDVLFLKPVEIFGKFDKFSMFNYTQPRSTHDDWYNISIPNFFNCGIRYYPQSMNSRVWDIGDAMMEKWNHTRWDAEQVVYNAMQWSQSSNVLDFLDPSLAFQVLSPNDCYEISRFNGIGLQQAKIAHFHGSRGSTARLELMQQVIDLTSLGAVISL